MVRPAGTNVEVKLGGNRIGGTRVGCRTQRGKEDHKLIDTGPYAFIPHPIYSGLVIALFATAPAEAVPALLGSGVMALQRLTKSDQGRCAPTR